MIKMKYLFFAVLLSLSFISTAFAYSDCRPTMFQAGTTLSHQEIIEQDLLVNRWAMKNAEGTTLYDFQDLGLVSQVHESVAGDFIYKEYLWVLHNIGDQVFLHLSTVEEGESLIYTVRQNCNGLVLTEVNQQNHYKLDYQGPKRAEGMQILHNDLPGMWQNINSGSWWYFAPDGTIQYPNQNFSLTEQGYYFLILDGKYLIINPADGPTEVLRVNSTDFGYLDVSLGHQDTRIMLEKTTYSSY